MYFEISANKFIALVLFSILCCSTAYATKSSDLTYLMNEPLTLFDYGMIKLSEDVKENWSEKYKENHLSMEHGAFASYDIETDRILFRGYFIGYTGEKDKKSLCIEALHTLRKPYKKLEFDLMDGVALGRFFNHHGYVKSSRPKKIGSGLMLLVDVSVVVMPNMGAEGSFECKGNLVSEKLYFSE
jgi:hypothetical protein